MKHRASFRVKRKSFKKRQSRLYDYDNYSKK